MTSLLIVEESLKTLEGHWFDYIRTIKNSALSLGVNVEIVCHKNAIHEITNEFRAYPIFNRARYLDSNQKKLPGEHYYGFLIYNFQYLITLWEFLSQHKVHDHIFVPTVLVHHLLAWLIIINFHPNKPRKLTLYFVTTLGVWNQELKTSSLPKYSRVQGSIMYLFKGVINRGLVTFGVGTSKAKEEFERLSKCPVKLFPYPVSQIEVPNEFESTNSLNFSQRPLMFACYGFARYEKGTDILKKTIEEILGSPSSWNHNLEFSLQWLEAFKMPDNSVCHPGELLLAHPRVSIIGKPLSPQEYGELLRKTHCLILPYRTASYYGRVSQVALDGMCLGIPIIYTNDGWLKEVVEEFGVGVSVEEDSVSSLMMAIQAMKENYVEYRSIAVSRMEKVRKYFSGEYFCQTLFGIN